MYRDVGKHCNFYAVPSFKAASISAVCSLIIKRYSQLNTIVNTF
jgi:hypothetical protein